MRLAEVTHRSSSGSLCIDILCNAFDQGRAVYVGVDFTSYLNDKGRVLRGGGHSGKVTEIKVFTDYVHFSLNNWDQWVVGIATFDDCYTLQPDGSSLHVVNL